MVEVFESSVVNGIYSGGVLLQINAAFKEDKVVRLARFLREDVVGSVPDVWFERFDPLRFRYEFSPAPSFVFSSDFLKVVSSIVGFDARISSAEFRRFRKGDYSLLYDDMLERVGVVALLDFSPIAWCEDWGGYTSFVRGDEKVRIVPEHNVLSLVMCEGFRSFTKYVNHHAKGDRIFIWAELEPK